MTGIVTYVYLYLYGENRLQYYARLNGREGLHGFLGNTQEGALLYSDYRPPAHSLLTDPNVLEGASEGVALCTVTEALILRYGMANERLAGEAEGRFFSLGGHLLGNSGAAADDGDAPSRTILDYEDQPPPMQVTPAFQEAFKHHPDAARLLVDEGIVCMADFQGRWSTLPVALANAIAINHYLLTVHDVLKSASNPDQADKESLTIACINLASAFPPWIKDWTPVLPFLDVRSSNVLERLVGGGPHALAAMRPSQVIGLPNFGLKSLRVTVKALSVFAEGKTGHLALTDYSRHAPDAAMALTDGPRGVSKALSHFHESDALSAREILDDIQLPSSLQGIADRALLALPRACEMLDFTTGRYPGVLRDRLNGDTLETCGERYGITREAIRQSERKALKWLTNHYPRILAEMKALCDGGVGDKTVVESYRDLRAFASVHVGMARLLEEQSEGVVRDWLALLTTSPDVGAIDNDKMLFELLSISPFHGDQFSGHFGIFTHGYNRSVAPVEAIVLPLPPTLDGDDVQRVIHEILLPSLVGLEGETTRPTGRAILIKHGLPWIVADLLMACAQIYWLAQDEEGVVYLPYATSDAVRERQDALELIQRAERPLHLVEDIFKLIRPGEADHHRPHAPVGSWIDSLQNQLHSSDPDYPVNIGNSYIATINQIGIASENIAECATYLESIMAQFPGREFSSRELAKVLQDANVPSFDWPDIWPGHPRITTHNIAHVILINQRRPMTRNMGRFVWKHGPWTDEADTANRTLIYEVYKDLFRERRQPIRARDLLDAVSELRGRGANSDQINETHGLVRLEGNGKDALFWDTDLGPLPGNSEAQDAIPESIKSQSDTDADTKSDVEGETDAELASGAEGEIGEVGDCSEIKAGAGAGAGAEICNLAQDICKALFMKKCRPIYARDLINAVEQENAQAIDVDKIQAIDGLVHIQGSGDVALFWDTDLDPWDDDEKPNVEALQVRVIQRIKTDRASIPVNRLANVFPGFYDLLVPLNDLEKAVLLARHPELKMHMGTRGRLTISLANGEEKP